MFFRKKVVEMTFNDVAVDGLLKDVLPQDIVDQLVQVEQSNKTIKNLMDKAKYFSEQGEVVDCILPLPDATKKIYNAYAGEVSTLLSLGMKNKISIVPL